jgi:hypothetical protein
MRGIRARSGVPASHEFAKTGSARNRENLPPPVQCSPTRRLRKLRMVLPMEGRSSQRFAASGRPLVLIPSNGRLLSFQTPNNRPQPASNGLFDQVKFQNLQEISLILWHLAPLHQFKIRGQQQWAGPARLLTILCRLPRQAVRARVL